MDSLYESEVCIPSSTLGPYVLSALWSWLNFQDIIWRVKEEKSTYPICSFNIIFLKIKTEKLKYHKSEKKFMGNGKQFGDICILGI